MRILKEELTNIAEINFIGAYLARKKTSAN